MIVEQNSGLDQYLKSVADSKNQFSRIAKPTDRIGQSCLHLAAENSPCCNVIAIAEPARQTKDLVSDRQRGIRQQLVDVYQFRLAAGKLETSLQTAAQRIAAYEELRRQYPEWSVPSIELGSQLTMNGAVASIANWPQRAREALERFDLTSFGAWHLAEILGVDPSTAQRVVFNAITKDAVRACGKRSRVTDPKGSVAQVTVAAVPPLSPFQMPLPRPSTLLSSWPLDETEPSLKT